MPATEPTPGFPFLAVTIGPTAVLELLAANEAEAAGKDRARDCPERALVGPLKQILPQNLP